jgi:hypothetical protein
VSILKWLKRWFKSNRPFLEWVLSCFSYTICTLLLIDRFVTPLKVPFLITRPVKHKPIVDFTGYKAVTEFEKDIEKLGILFKDPNSHYYIPPTDTTTLSYQILEFISPYTPYLCLIMALLALYDLYMNFKNKGDDSLKWTYSFLITLSAVIAAMFVSKRD